MRILVVEDEKKIANSIKQGLEQESFSVDVVYDGQDGYELAISESYDLIILDLMLPTMNGILICTKLRNKNINTPILMLTAKDETEDKVDGLNSGADDYLAKPFAFTELVARSRALLRRPSNIVEESLTCFDLSLNTQTFTVTREGKNIDLSRKEFALLEFLVRNKNIILTKDKIINNVWNYDSDVLPNTVEVYIAYLRNKIDKPFKHLAPIVKTIRGFGYKVEDKNV